MLMVLTYNPKYRLIIFPADFTKSRFFRRFFQKHFVLVDMRLVSEMGIFIVTLAVFWVLFTEQCDHARGEDVCIAKRFFLKKAQGKSLQMLLMFLVNEVRLYVSMPWISAIKGPQVKPVLVVPDGCSLRS